MRRYVLQVLMSCLALVGCAAQDPDKQAALAGSCQVQKCVCGPSGWSPLSASGGVPIVWRPDGKAACPEGYVLHAVVPPPHQ